MQPYMLTQTQTRKPSVRGEAIVFCSHTSYRHTIITEKSLLRVTHEGFACEIGHTLFWPHRHTAIEQVSFTGSRHTIKFQHIAFRGANR